MQAVVQPRGHSSPTSLSDEEEKAERRDGVQAVTMGQECLAGGEEAHKKYYRRTVHVHSFIQTGRRRGRRNASTADMGENSQGEGCRAIQRLSGPLPVTQSAAPSAACRSLFSLIPRPLSPPLMPHVFLCSV